MSLAVQGLRWTKDCGRLARECRQYCVFRISGCCGTENTWLKLSRPVPQTISRPLTRWSALRGILLTSTEIRGSYRAVSIIPNQDTRAISEDECIEKSQATRKARASLRLAQLLGIDIKEARNCLENYPGFITNLEDISQNYQACRDAGISETVIKEHLEILAYPCSIHEMKLKFIANMDIDHIDGAVPFFELEISQLCSFSNQLKYETAENNGVHRITYLAEKLQCPTLSICQVLAKHYFMRSTPFLKLRRVLKLMLDFDVSKDDILGDIWAFRYNPQMISDRLKRATDAGVHPLKPWMIRCTGRTLSRRIGKEIRQRSVLGDKGTVVEYLSQRFECHSDLITSLIAKNPKVARVNGPKLKRVVDFLLENGYTVDDIMQVPRVLFNKVETMENRLTELQKYGYRAKSLMILCKSKRDYAAQLNRIKLRILTNDKV